MVKAKRLAALPLLAFLFVIGWLLYCNRKKRTLATISSRKAEASK